MNVFLFSKIYFHICLFIIFNLCCESRQEGPAWPGEECENKVNRGDDDEEEDDDEDGDDNKDNEADDGNVYMIMIITRMMM